MLNCELCGKEADKHHVVHKSEGGLNFPLNLKYLCSEHHRGRNGPHKDINVDIKYKLELKKKVENILYKEYYFINDLGHLLDISNRRLKGLLKDCRLHKEGYETCEIIYMLMGRKDYEETMIDNYEDFVQVCKLA